MNVNNPLIGETHADTVNNVSEALGALLVLMSRDHGGIARLLEPLLHALEHVVEQEV